jgi:hypothetical protein
MAEDPEQLKAQIDDLRARLTKAEIETQVEKRVSEELAKRAAEKPPEPERRSTMSAARKSQLIRQDPEAYRRLPW